MSYINVFFLSSKGTDINGSTKCKSSCITNLLTHIPLFYKMLSDMRRWVFQALTASWCGGGCSGWMFIAARDRKQKAESHQDAHTSALIYLLTNVKPIQTIFICSPGGVSVRLWRVKLLVYMLLRREVWGERETEREAAGEISSRKISPQHILKINTPARTCTVCLLDA